MRILFLSYWVFNDPLTTATVLPHLRLLHERTDVEAVLLVTVERGPGPAPVALNLPFPADKITYAPLLSPPGKALFVRKTDDFLRFPRELATLAAGFGADFILARGAAAGSLAYLVWRQTKLPFFVESFEPHAEYMRQAGEWRWFDPRYLFQQHWENQQKRFAQGLMPVAENFRRRLLAEGVAPARVVTVPCSVNLDDFAARPAARLRVRQQLGLAEVALVGVYAGKFGGIYYDAPAFALFREVADFFGAEFRLLLLSPHPADELRAKLTAAGLDPGRASIVFAPFREVPDYLSAADFAFGLHLPTPYVSPIKVGEYWANGLPVLMPEGVGDDSDIVAREGGGAVFNFAQPGSTAAALARLRQLLHDPAHRAVSRGLATRYRSVDRAREAYAALLPAVA